MANPAAGGGAEAWKYLSIAGYGTVDVIIGTAIAYLIQQVFMQPVKGGYCLPKDLQAWVVLLIDTFFQAILTLFLGIETRNLFFGNPENFLDPTGGILFVLSLFRQQNFWEKIDAIATSLTELLKGANCGSGDNTDKQGISM